jgi:tetratricopeptide (TPR) repeat protein
MLSGGLIQGRDRELATLRALVRTGLDQGSAILLIGEPGIGKSALLAATVTAAVQAGYTVLRAAGVESQMHLPFGGIHQAFAPLTRHFTSLPDPQRQALETALGLSDGSNPDLFLIAEAAFAVVGRERQERPVVLVVDDVHWLDPQSHQILTFVAHRAAAAGLCVVAAIRPGHPGPFVDAGFPRLPVQGLDNDAAEVILSTHAGTLSAATRRRIRQEAQGNPLALMELPRSWGDGPPTDAHPPAISARLEQAFAGRISELPAVTRDALLLAATSSSADPDEILAGLRAFGSPEVSSAVLQPAAAAGLIGDDPSRISFRHPLVRSGVLQRETLARRHGAHAALADVLTEDAYRRTWHRAWSIVGPDDGVADALAATVPDSLRRGAAMTAVSSLERAAQLTCSSTRRGERLIHAAQLAFGVGRADVVARIIREAAQVDLTDLDRTRVTWLSETLNDDVRADSARVRYLCDSARCAHALGDLGLALNLLVGGGLRCWWADSGADDRSEILRVLDQLGDVRADPRHVAAAALTEPVLRASEVMASLRSAALQEVCDGDSLRVYGMAAYSVGDLVLATDLLDRAEEAFRAEGRLGMLPLVLALQLHIRLDLGDWAGADLASTEVVTISRETGQAVFADNNVLVEARAKALRGEWPVALAVMADAETQAASLRINDRLCLAYQARGTALLSADRPAEAFACLERSFDPSDPGYHLRESFAAVALMAEAAVDCGRVAQARVITETLQTVAVITPSPLLAVNLLYASAVLAPDELRERRYREAFGHDLTRWPWMRARLQLAYGQWLSAAGRPAEATGQLRAALAVFERNGAARWERRAVLTLRGLEGGSRP